MSEIVGQDPVLSPAEQIDAQAAAWFIDRNESREWTEKAQAEFDAWLAQSPMHLVAYWRVEIAWARVRSLKAVRPQRDLRDEANLSPISNRRDWSFWFKRVEKSAARAEGLAAWDAHERGQVAPSAGDKFRYRRFVFPLLAAASVAVVTVWGPSLMASWFTPPDRTDSTDVGGRTLLSFGDHTQIELNTATAVRLRMTNKERTVWLEKGEAWFHVAHDAAHPFTVVAGTHRITDIGTEFLIRRDGDAVDVILLKGRATVSSEGLQTATLLPGEQAVATPVSLSVTQKSPQELADALAWRKGLLVFRKTPLAEVVREFNRYNTVKLVIADPSIANETATADLRTDDYETFLLIAERMMNLRVDREGGVIRISRAERPETKDTTKSAAHAKRGP